MPKRKRTPDAEHHELLTAEQARKRLDEQGLSIEDFAKRHAVDARAVSRVLRGLNRGRRGEAHRAAVLLGMKHGIALPPSA